ncbi:MAG TPA: regulatory iron-sulfur-containing complex subunit RicT, partial [Tepidisphaeraceae bacterium]|nr:regulatory iron-sulfur-containing complex subunit RicT [Tepidisphaeraceae bacterium]
MSSSDLPDNPTPTPEIPRSVVVSYGHLRLLGEFAYDGDTRPCCGAKVVLRTRRGTELGQVMTTTCPEYSCSRSITREQLQTYIGNSGASDYPFSNDGRVLRIATPEDLQEQARIEQERSKYLTACDALVAEMQLPMKLVDVELLLGGEMATFFFLSENRVDFRNLVKQLAAQFHTRIQMHQVGARDEARLVADYETCGQHCCCRQFLKVLRPVNMGAAKMQKATLDPSKISGRCGRLKCCLR